MLRSWQTVFRLECVSARFSLAARLFSARTAVPLDGRATAVLFLVVMTCPAWPDINWAAHRFHGPPCQVSTDSYVNYGDGAKATGAGQHQSAGCSYPGLSCRRPGVTPHPPRSKIFRRPPAPSKRNRQHPGPDPGSYLGRWHTLAQAVARPGSESALRRARVGNHAGIIYGPRDPFPSPTVPSSRGLPDPRKQ